MDLRDKQRLATSVPQPVSSGGLSFGRPKARVRNAVAKMGPQFVHRRIRIFHCQDAYNMRTLAAIKY